MYLLCLTLLSISTLSSAIPTTTKNVVVYRYGDPIDIQCKSDVSSSWGPGPICKQTGKGMQFLYGIDGNQECGWEIDSQKTMNYIRSLLNAEANLVCRIAMTPDEFPFYIPFTIPLWGKDEVDHVHVGIHLNFIFHAEKGKIVAVAAYPVREPVIQHGVNGSILQLHGPSKWFQSHTFRDYIIEHAAPSPNEMMQVVAFWGGFTLVSTLTVASTFYLFVLKPHILQSVPGGQQKKDG
ncbi:hypothetical protein PROFUN_06027 [Planoprotostelium fungivorum]|uniref:Uncharacterized protein n=1 Tax=Planoprotostelium fungivorum TaxID=1890364 RepID=A0A2P6MQN2_9EUKA|nr:hypothetical protein PROFUN_16446 [Planoprotostelium fungivorum]PRP85905.1 hypothetical protein PROFUN_06027 [Planoprotostelium fungivorum]